MPLLRTMVMGLTGLLLALPAGIASAQDAGRVRLGQISLSFYAVTGGVVQEVLERLGHDVELTQGSHAQIFPRLGAGEVDLLVAAWLPHGHAVYWEQYGPKAEALAVLYEGARFAWMVPTYVPEAAVSGVADLLKPEVQARMERVIQGTGRDSGNMMLSAEVMQAYGLEQAAYRLQPGDLAQFHGAYDRNIAARNWFVMPLWYPHYINRVGNMRPLAEPRGLLGPPSNGTLVASREWVQRASPRTLQVLRRLQLGLDAVAQMDYSVNVDKQPPREAARTWMRQHADAVEGWFAD
jgi:glycine betaine/proline transport system substrate-binding protein